MPSILAIEIGVYPVSPFIYIILLVCIKFIAAIETRHRAVRVASTLAFFTLNLGFVVLVATAKTSMAFKIASFFTAAIGALNTSSFHSSRQSPLSLFSFPFRRLYSLRHALSSV